MSECRVQVAIIGAGPAGLTLGRLLHLAGISFVIVERQSRAYVEARIRAGVLEHGSVDTLTAAGADARLRREGLIHDGVEIAFGERRLRIDFAALTGHAVTVYGQTEITRDLNELHAADGAAVHFECSDVGIEHVAPGACGAALVQATTPRGALAVRCDYVAGCDGFHGVTRSVIPASVRQDYERVYPVGWLGVLADAPPLANELIYANHERGFALCSMRSPTRSRYYVQVGSDEDVAAWPDTKFWDELRARLPAAAAEALATAPSIEKSVAPLRSFVTEPMRFGRLFLAGDAAHIVPPTGAKGLNLALADVAALAAGLEAFYRDGNAAALDNYSTTCLQRVWKAERFSWWFTALTHRLSDESFQRKLQIAEFDYLAQSQAAMTVLAENYVGQAQAAVGVHA